MGRDIPTSDPCGELVAARRDLLAVVEDLSPTEWDKPSLCTGWRVRDVVAHVAQLPDMKRRNLLPRIIKARGSLTRVRDEAARTEGEQPASEILAHFRENLECLHVPPGSTAEKALVDIVVHSLDICHPNGWELPLPADRVRAAMSILVTLGEPFGGKHRAEGLHLDTTDVDWRFGRGDHVRGPAPVMLLALAGRPVCDQLTGEGVRALAARAVI